ncbi:ABC transporter substrate-binding protein [Corynebacterium cystitidis]|uniref:ABC transporter substrate-binding protein n=1 Tax=Corynebacterium cystitidis TaxID=35757 RepID=UPI00211E1902|nr:ABC transporter substrate-binding protein [Corynebacterium cystitidis]
MKLNKLIASVVGSALLLTGCSNESSTTTETTQAEGTITVTDQRGEEITIETPVERIASAVIPAPTIIAAVDGSWDRIVGINESLLKANQEGIISQIFPASVSTPVVSDRQFTPNMETILSQDPDVFIQWGDRSEDIIAPLDNAGIPTLGLEYGTQEDLETWITLFGEVLGKEDRSERLISWMHEEQEAVSEQVESLGKPKVRGLQMSYSDEAIKVDTEKHYAQHVFGLAGVENMASSAVSQDGVVSAEQILDWDPEIIFLSAFDEAVPDDVYNDPRLSEVTAVKERRVYRAPLGVYRWQVPSAESPLYWNYVAALAYPGEYEVDLPEMMRENISWIFNYELSEEDIELILRTDINNGSANYDLVAQ